MISIILQFDKHKSLQLGLWELSIKEHHVWYIQKLHFIDLSVLMDFFIWPFIISYTSF